MVFVFDEFVLDLRAFELTYRGRSRPLQKRPFDLLTYLVQHRDRVVTKAEILSEVWGGVRVTENALAQAIANVRCALGRHRAEAIRSVRSRGYRFMLPVDTMVDETGAQSEPRILPRETLRVSAHAREAMGTFRTLLRAYSDARPGVLVEGASLTSALAHATTHADIVGLVLALFGDPTQAPAEIVVEHLERADIESLLLYTALTARPYASLILRDTCAWAELPRGSPVARLIRDAVHGVPRSAA